MKAQSYIKQFDDYNSAFDFMRMKNTGYHKANNSTDTVCVVSGADGNNFAVVDLKTAIELELGYVVSTSGWIDNPWQVETEQV